MLIEEVNKINYSVVEKIKAYFQLLKFRLSFLVTFSGGIAFLLASRGETDWNALMLFSIAGFMVTGSANIINQIIEIDTDKLMKRTMNRPLPTGVLSVQEAALFSVALGVAGIVMHFMYFNMLTAVLSLISLLLYGFVYTPLKKVGPIAVFVGAFPGALPPMIGWVAMTGNIGYEALILFGIQFVWQFPHFWAVAWVAFEDYTKAGFKLLPYKGGRDTNTAFTIMIYTLFLIPISLLPFVFGLTGKTSAIIVTITGLVFLSQTFFLMKKCDRNAALWTMFGSFLYLPIVQIALLFDKV